MSIIFLQVYLAPLLDANDALACRIPFAKSFILDRLLIMPFILRKPPIPIFIGDLAEERPEVDCSCLSVAQSTTTWG